MARDVLSGNVVEVTCPHCHKAFTPDPLARPSARHRGFKCPHCRLFVPIERAPSHPDRPAPGGQSPPPPASRGQA